MDIGSGRLRRLTEYLEGHVFRVRGSLYSETVSEDSLAPRWIQDGLLDSTHEDHPGFRQTERLRGSVNDGFEDQSDREHDLLMAAGRRRSFPSSGISSPQSFEGMRKVEERI